MKNRSFSRASASFLVISTLFSSSAALAELPADRPTRLPSFGRSIVSTDDTTALYVNPANLAFMQSAELRWASLYMHEAARVPWQGHSITFAFPLPIVALSTGLRVDLIDPPHDGAERIFNGQANYQWLTWGLAYKGSDQFGLGFTWQRSYSEAARAHGLSSWSLGLTTRPWDYFGLAGVVRDLNAPSNSAGGFIERSYQAGIAIRPFRSRVAELGLEGKYVDADDGYWVPRATLGIDIPELGRLRGDFTMQDPTEEVREREWIASAAMSFYFNGSTGSMELGAGSVFGDALGPSADSRAHENLQFDVAVRGFREAAGAEAPLHALRIRIEDTPGVREHTALLRRLWSIAEEEPSVSGVVLELRTSPASSLAHAQELRDALFLLRQAGKRVLCHLEDSDGMSLYLCSAADRILLNPAGGIRFAGLKTRYFYYAGLLSKLGIRADFVRIGDHKSAPEAFTREGASEVARADKIDILQQYEKHFTAGVAGGRRLTPEALRQSINKGPFVATEAKSAGLVDGFAFDDQLEDEVTRLLGHEARLIDDKRAARTPKFFGKTPGIAIVYVDGDMVDGRSQTIPLIGMKLCGSYTIAESLKQARENPMVGAVVLRVETGGGSAMAADVIWREIQLTTQVKPVIVSMGSAAASGGYYIAAAGTRVLANPLTVTGSIGIFYGKADVAELLRKIGVGVEVYKTAPRADAESIFRPFTKDERTELERKVAQFYDMFLSRVAEGRKLSKAQVDAVGQGRVWTGEQARDRKLVDELGGLRQALELAKKLAGLREQAPIYELPPSDTSLLGRLLGIEGIHAETRATEILPPQMVEMVRALAPFVAHAPDKPLARMEFTLVEP